MRDLTPHDDGAVETVVLGLTPPGRRDLADLAAFVRVVRRTYDSTPVPSPARDLASVLNVSLTDKGDLPTMAASNGQGPAPQAGGLPKLKTTTKRTRNKLLTSVSALVGTVAGKIGLGVAIAAASVGTLHAAGVVDVPGVPDSVPFVDAAGPPDSTPPEGAGVDGSKVSERASAGEPREDGRAFGLSIAADATEGTPAQAVGGAPESVPDPPEGVPGAPEVTLGPPDDTPEPPSVTTGPPDDTPTGPGDTPAGSRP